MSARCFLLAIMAAGSLGPATAFACEVATPPPDKAERDLLARQWFERAPALYEGIILSGPDIGEGGLFLALRTHKGPGWSPRIIALPHAGGCVGALGASSIGETGLLDPATYSLAGFDGLVPGATVDSWERQGLIDGARVTGTKILGVLGAFAAIVVGAILVRRRRRRS